MKRLLAQAQAAARSPSLFAQNQALFVMAVAAYRVRAEGPVGPANASSGDGLEARAKRVLRRIDPDHPNVKRGQWLDALLRRFYADAAARCRTLGRFSRNRRDRVFFDGMAQQAAIAAEQLARTLELQVEGLDGFSAPLPVVDGDEPYPHVCQAVVTADGGINIDAVQRVRFVDHRPPAAEERTGRGALRKLHSAFLFFERSASSLARYDRAWAKKRGHVRAVVPAQFPARYLNEIAKAAREAKIRRLHVMVMTSRGELRELGVDLMKSKRKKQRRRSRDVTCDDDVSMTRCAERIAYAGQRGRPYLATR